MSQSPPPVLRVNALRRRAAELGTDVFHVVRFDATGQREQPPSEDGEDAEIDSPLITKSAHNRGDTPSVSRSAKGNRHPQRDAGSRRQTRKLPPSTYEIPAFNGVSSNAN